MTRRHRARDGKEKQPSRRRPDGTVRRKHPLTGSRLRGDDWAREHHRRGAHRTHHEHVRALTRRRRGPRAEQRVDREVHRRDRGRDDPARVRGGARQRIGAAEEHERPNDSVRKLNRSQQDRFVRAIQSRPDGPFPEPRNRRARHPKSTPHRKRCAVKHQRRKLKESDVGWLYPPIRRAKHAKDHQHQEHRGQTPVNVDVR